MIKTLRIATRMSQLALWQARHIQFLLTGLYPDLKIEIIPLKTQGDKLLNSSLSKIGGKGLFVKELEEALLNNHADIAVHSVKDVPFELPDKLVLSAFCSREEPRDVLVSRTGKTLENLPESPIIGTSSLRRQAQVNVLRSDCEFRLLRGNVPTRVEKLHQGEYDAIILAAAGLERLNLQHHITQVFSLEEILPAVGQGALGVECRKNDTEIIELLKPLNDKNVSVCIKSERAMNARLGGSCQVPIAGYACLENDSIKLTGRVCNASGSIILESNLTAPIDSAVELGEQVAQKLLEQGAANLIKDILNNV